jgi:hypothetical protein
MPISLSAAHCKTRPPCIHPVSGFTHTVSWVIIYTWLWSGGQWPSEREIDPEIPLPANPRPKCPGEHEAFPRNSFSEAQSVLLVNLAKDRLSENYSV